MQKADEVASVTLKEVAAVATATLRHAETEARAKQAEAVQILAAAAAANQAAALLVIEVPDISFQNTHFSYHNTPGYYVDHCAPLASRRSHYHRTGGDRPREEADGPSKRGSRRFTRDDSV